MNCVMNAYLKRTRSLVALSAFALGLACSVAALADNPAVPAGSAPMVASSGGGLNLASQPGGIMAFAPFVLMFGVLYLLVLRPQQKKIRDQQKEQQDLLSSLKYGDEIITASGLLGKLTGITEKVVTLEVADNVRIKMMKSQVSQVVKGSIKDIAP